MTGEVSSPVTTAEQPSGADTSPGRPSIINQICLTCRGGRAVFELRAADQGGTAPHLEPCRHCAGKGRHVGLIPPV
ncbi:conserved hypothetical protein [Frankia sp. Hr75.2]|nr:conserved hypothetical protein [Frankia sp. Hr75.2]SQD98149.1 conserved hypothetical protein [Parafrankia sp. Ea1.12]SQD98168.1 conserved hypothetical protein [Parafrankia sp. Ea1.12]